MRHSLLSRSKRPFPKYLLRAKVIFVSSMTFFNDRPNPEVHIWTALTTISRSAFHMDFSLPLLYFVNKKKPEQRKVFTCIANFSWAVRDYTE